jgi:hypothetical protein
MDYRITTGMLNNNILLFEHDESSQYFVQTRVKNSDVTLFDRVMELLTSDSTGMMIYGGYGLGKTTFSLYLASVLAKKYLDGEFERIPIRIALGGMYSKQDLISSAFEWRRRRCCCEGFFIWIFLEMNLQDQYLLILDGFDEMRHAMELDDFVYTFEQMRHLFAGKAKIIILGPDSFLSNEEEEQVLSALFETRITKSTGLAIVEVSFFAKPEILGYLNNYIMRTNVTLTEDQKRNYQVLIGRLPDSDDGILSRPVQLKMFTKVSDECLSKEIVLNRYELYKRFIYNFITRESRKAARQPTNDVLTKKDLRDDGAKFMQSMAWWLLTEKKENRFVAEEIPIELIPDGIRAKREKSAAIREAIVGSVIEPVSKTGVLGSKAKRYYYFPHKSYLEFLVANYLESHTFFRESYRKFISLVNHEILTFIEEGPSTGVARLRDGVTYSRGTIDRRVIECTSDKKIASEIRGSKRQNFHPIDIYTHYIYLRKHQMQPDRYLLARLADSTTAQSVLTTYNCIASELSSASKKHLARALLLNCIGSSSIHQIVRCAKTGDSVEVYGEDIDGIRLALLSKCFKRNKKKDIVLSAENMSQFIRNVCAMFGYVYVDLSNPTNKLIKLTLESEYLTEAMSEAPAIYVNSIVKRDGDSQEMIQVEIMGRLADLLK